MPKPPYVSTKRNEPRAIGPVRFNLDGVCEGNLASDIQPKSGVLPYRISGPTFIETFSQSRTENRRLLTKEFEHCSSRIRKIIELEYRIASSYFWLIDGIGCANVSEAYRPLTRTFAANLVFLNTAFELTLDGLYSNARPLMRQAFEGSMIAKLCSVDPALDVHDKWLDSQYIQFTPNILHRIKSPSTDDFRTFWKDLSGFTHASHDSGQPDLSNEAALSHAPLNFIFLQVLLAINYHLLSSHIVTNSLRHYQKNYSDYQGLSSDRTALTKLLRIGSTPWMAKPARNIIKTFRATWTLQ